MIDTTLHFTANAVNQFVRNKFGLDESKVLINSIVDQDGSVPKANQNKLVISLINVVQETNKRYYNTNRKQRLHNGDFSDVNPSECYNIDILLSSNFQDYKESLKFLNAGILFFQTYHMIDSTSFSDLPEGISKLEYDIEKISFFEIHNLWSAMGAKYVPSVIYRMRLITIDSDQATGFTVPVNTTNTSLTSA